MKEQLITTLISMVIRTLDEEKMKKLADVILDFVEDKVEESSTKWDDAVILPLCKMVRNAFGIEE